MAKAAGPNASAGPSLVAIADIQVIEELYPRKRQRDGIVAQYRQALDFLPPVTLVRRDSKAVLVDGYHRLLAFRLENRPEVPAEFVDCNDILLEAIRRNAAHGYQLEDADKGRCARALYNRAENPVKDEAALGAILGVSDRAIRGYLADIKRQEKDARNTRIRELWLDCYSQEEIAEKVGDITEQHVGKILEELPKSSPAPPASLQTWTLWEEWPECDERYGSDYPGRMPGQVVENLLHYLTEPGDCVLDPMAGSGTTRDVCQAMGRRCYAADCNPLPGKPYLRHLAIDAAGSLPEVPGTVKRAGGFQLILLDPPYWQQADYGDAPENLGAIADFADYADTVAVILAHSLATVKPSGYVAIISSSTMRDRQVYQPMSIWCHHALALGATLWDWVIVPYTSERAAGFHVSDAQRAKRLLRRHRDLAIFQRA